MLLLQFDVQSYEKDVKDAHFSYLFHNFVRKSLENNCQMILLTGKEGLIHRTGKEIQNVFQNLFKQRGKWRREAAKLSHYYSMDAPRAQNAKKQIICMFDGRMHHGGLADRLRGIVSTYYVCKQKGYDFRIHFVHPFCLEDYLVPNKVDWRIKEEEISYHQKDAAPMFCGSNGTLVEPGFQELWFKKKFAENYAQVHVYTNALLLPHGHGFHDLFEELFRPSKALEDALKRYMEPLSEGYYAMTLRFQQLLGDFKEGQYTVLSSAEQQLLMDRCLTQIQKIYDALEEKKMILITSDSTRFLQFVDSKLDFVYVVHGTVAHMDWQTNIPFDVNLKSFVDLLMIGHSKCAYLLQTGKMYNSGFPRRAAQIGGIPFRHIRF